MIIDMSNFGEMLQSRPAGREDFLKAQAYVLNTLKSDEDIILDFADVKVLAPSWADEFITELKNKYKNPIRFINTENPSVTATLNFISKPIDMSQLKKLA